ncbi:MAG: LamG domain-containing protein [Gammaproteobacteria bacterium]|nr:LamG domain-containing protein [Gammaproteobacteria bacterium]
MSKIPTIAMIPSGYKANKVYSVLPTNGDADLSFSRTSEATRVNQLGLIETVATGVPRLDYSDGGCPSLLVEPQSTNLITYSEDFSNGAYVKDAGITVPTQNNLSPKGDLTASEISATNDGRIYQNTSSGTYTTSVFIKAGSFSNFKVGTSSVDLVAKTTSLAGSNITEFANGWFRVDVPFTGTRPFQVQAYPDNTYAPHTTTGNYFLWGAQVEQLSYPTSYIPTTGATATRVAETVSKTGLENYINSSEGVLYAEISALNDDTTPVFISLSDNTTNNRICIYFQDTRIRGFIIQNITPTLTFSNTTVDVSLFHKIAISYTNNEAKMFIDGSFISSIDLTSTAFSSSLKDVRFDNGGGGTPLYGKVKDLRVYNQALTDQELQELTS